LLLKKPEHVFAGLFDDMLVFHNYLLPLFLCLQPVHCLIMAVEGGAIVNWRYGEKRFLLIAALGYCRLSPGWLARVSYACSGVRWGNN